MCLYDHYLENLKILNYTPVGLGNGNFRKEWLRDSEGNNISNKNKYYGEYTFHYWLWKNGLKSSEKEWIGFCQYRKFWGIQKKPLINDNLEDFKNEILLANNKKCKILENVK